MILALFLFYDFALLANLKKSRDACRVGSWHQEFWEYVVGASVIATEILLFCFEGTTISNQCRMFSSVFGLASQILSKYNNAKHVLTLIIEWEVR